MKTSALTRQQIADQYGVCRRTLNRWLKANGIKLENGLITPIELDLIRAKIGKFSVDHESESEINKG